MNIQPKEQKQWVPVSIIAAVGLIVSALILKSDALPNPFFVPPGPGYQRVASQFKTQMEAGLKGRVFGKTHRWDGVQVHYVTFEKAAESYRVSYSIVLHDTEKNLDVKYGSNCPLMPSGSSQYYSGTCSRIYDPETGHVGSDALISVR